MDPGANPSRETPKPAGVPGWPIAVQLALGLIATASLFFMLGRWSQAGLRGEPVLARESALPAAIDLNRATRAELRLLPGLGDALAQRVLDRRVRIGQFRSVDDLRQVSGIGPKTLERLRPHVFVLPVESFVSDDDGDEMPALPSMPRSTASSTKASKLTAPININRAAQAELQKLPGIGPKLSQRILDERSKGAFKTIEELRRVSGIGPKTLEKLRPFVTVE